jgi:hypothetical protein
MRQDELSRMTRFRPYALAVAASELVAQNEIGRITGAVLGFVVLQVTFPLCGDEMAIQYCATARLRSF